MFKNVMSIRLRCLISEITGRDFDSLSVIKQIGKKHNFSLTEQQWEHLGWLWYEPIGALAKVEDDICSTLENLKAMGLKLGILSNTFVHSTTLIKHLKQFGIWEFFDDSLFSYDFAFRKPDKRIFLAAAERIGVIPENILFIGDRIKADVKGSLGSGMIAALKKAYTNKGKTLPRDAYFVENISQLPEIIREHNKIIK
jgi:HAD superfamily hydrolase (TIGR01549 family)